MTQLYHRWKVEEIMGENNFTRGKNRSKSKSGVILQTISTLEKEQGWGVWRTLESSPLSIQYCHHVYWLWWLVGESLYHTLRLITVIVIQSQSHIQLSATPWTAAHQASLSFTISWSLFKLMSIELVMLSNHLILCHPRLLLPSIFPSTMVFSNESALRIRWPKY